MTIHCESCENDVDFPARIELVKDKLNVDAWTDIVCPNCHFVIATVCGDEGVYTLKKYEV